MDKAEGIMCPDFKLYYKAGRSPGEGNGNPLQYYAWRIPWTEEPDRLQSMGSQRVKHDWAANTNNTVVKIVWYWHKNRHIDQWDKTERKEINLYIQGQLISNERAKNTQQGQDSFFNDGAGKLDNHMQKNETGCLSYTIHNNQLKMD